MNGSSFVRVSKPIKPKPPRFICLRVSSNDQLVQGRLKQPIGQTVRAAKLLPGLPNAIAPPINALYSMNSRLFILRSVADFLMLNRGLSQMSTKQRYSENRKIAVPGTEKTAAEFGGDHKTEIPRTQPRKGS